MIRSLRDPEVLESFFERSAALWAAVLTPDGVVVEASGGLRAAVGGGLEGREFAKLVVPARQSAFAQLLERSADAAWVDATIAMRPSPLREPVERLVHLRRNPTGLLLIAEPTDREHEQRLEEPAGIGDALVAAQRELAHGRRSSLLPLGALDLVAHYQPQAEGSAVGGDWYEAITFPDGQVALCIGDVAGKGMQAAATMGQVRSAMTALALSHREPGDLLERLDRFVSGLGTMVTALYLLVDPVGATVTYARAGHLPPLLRHPDGRVSLLEGALAPPLAFGVQDRRQVTAPLEPGSQLVLYTDGLVERRGEGLGAAIEALRRCCEAADVAPGRLGAHLIDAFSDDAAGFVDDVAVLTAFLPAR